MRSESKSKSKIEIIRSGAAGSMDNTEAILGGIRVLEVATYIFGPACGTVMADFGAEVIKVESPSGDPYRNLYKIPTMPVCEINYNWVLDNRSKKSIAINLADEEGREALLRLVRSADVFLTNYQPSILARFRLAYEDLAPLNERLIYAHATGYGEAGDEVEKPGFDMAAYWARSGLMDTVRSGEDDPALSMAGQGDHAGAMTLMSGVLLAMLARQKTGQGTKVSSSLLANGAWANACMIEASLCGGEPYQRRPRTHPRTAMINHYRARDGRRVMIVSLRPNDWMSLCRAIGREDLISDPRFASATSRDAHTPDFVAIVDDAFAQKDLAEWEALLTRHDVTFSRVQTVEEAANDPQMAATGIYAEVDDPVHGRLRIIDSPVWLKGHEKREPSPAPGLGSHTADVLREAGYSEDEVRGLAARGAIALG